MMRRCWIGDRLQWCNCRVSFYFRLGSIPNGADPMVEWLVVFLVTVFLIFKGGANILLLANQPNFGR